jgi:hypothetical protein
MSAIFVGLGLHSYSMSLLAVFPFAAVVGMGIGILIARGGEGIRLDRFRRMLEAHRAEIRAAKKDGANDTIVEAMWRSYAALGSAPNQPILPSSPPAEPEKPPPPLPPAEHEK